MTEAKKSNWGEYVSPNVYDGVRDGDPVKATKTLKAFKEKAKKIEAKRLARTKV